MYKSVEWQNARITKGIYFQNVLCKYICKYKLDRSIRRVAQMWLNLILNNHCFTWLSVYIYCCNKIKVVKEKQKLKHSAKGNSYCKSHFPKIDNFAIFCSMKFPICMPSWLLEPQRISRVHPPWIWFKRRRGCRFINFL